ncbi:hypothetical protein ACIQRE_01865 [Streptomyces griseoluteus]|uniref:hypothetical protein n=1 Tax=Streptomyces griseoluteus TaxID=29306 RepID=UPI0037FBDC8C
MHASKRVVTIERHEWALESPAHHTDVDKALAVANQERSAIAASGAHTGDVHVWGRDEGLVVSFETQRPSTTRSETTDV